MADADTGIGIRPEMLGRIFDVFTQADRVEGRVNEGLGLGLTLVKSLTELHGGPAEARSKGPGRGSEFVVRLPVPADAASAGPAVLEPADIAPAGGEFRILVVDDNVDAADSLAMLLRLAGHDVRVVHDGPAALGAAVARRPACVFLDIGLPGGMDGYEVARRMRGRPGLDGVVLVALTGWGQGEDRRSRVAGFDHHLVKPADLARVEELLRVLTESPARGSPHVGPREG